MKFKIPFTNRAIEIRSSLANPKKWLINLLTGGVESKAGIKVTDDNAIKISAVFACINIISNTIASLGCHLYQITSDGKKRDNSNYYYRLLRYLPNLETTAFEFWTMYIINLILTGDAFAYIKRDGNGFIKELWNIPTQNVKIYRNEKTRELYYVVYDDKNNKETYYPENIMHTRGLRFKDNDKSLNPINLAREAIGINIALEEYAAKYFKNGANSGGIVEVDGKLGEEAFIRFKDSFNEKYAGVGNSSKVLFLESGMKYTKLGNAPKDSQAIESRKFQVIEIARFFNVPPHKIMDLERATFSNIEQQNIDFAQSCIEPICERIEQTIYKSIFSEKEKKKYFVKFNINKLLRADINSKRNYYTSGIQNGFLCPDDVRALEDMNKIPSDQNGGLYMVNGNMIPLKNILKSGEKNGEGN
jgi:HK97 family phage portal protein